uniref:SRS domain containing protein, putative n=1 Tax=Toxoplasma gondii (strain ATCC 50861 / VEG) TaxID=432359 RepID=A0A0F7V3W4_TOXGV|nr:TPA: SRS domain containing protein, putative [Toxoplasma gondii VEG]
MAARSMHVKHSICSWPHCFRWQQQALLSVISGAVVVSSLVAVVCAAAQIPLTCNDNSRFLTKSLKTKGESIAFQCPEGLTFVPNVAEQESCADSTCNKKRKLLTDFITLEPTQHTLSAAVQQQSSTAPKVTITLKDPEEESSTLYLLCQTPVDKQELLKNGVDRLSQQPTTCTLQVPMWGSIAFKAFGGAKCDTEYALTSLGLPKASLVEGNTGTGNKPLYNFDVASLPLTTSVSMCYKFTTDGGKAL